MEQDRQLIRMNKRISEQLRRNNRFIMELVSWLLQFLTAWEQEWIKWMIRFAQG